MEYYRRYIMGNYNDFDLNIKKVQGENDIGPAFITTTIIRRFLPIWERK